MPSFGPDTYGDAFADVYDEWYSDVSDADATARFVLDRCGTGPILELGVGTGRIALPLTDHQESPGRFVIGVDASVPMLQRCVEAAGERTIALVQADLANLPINGPVGVALCAFNTLFNLTTEDEQLALLTQLATAVGSDGAVIIEAITGLELGDGPPSSVGVSRMEVDRLVLSATVVDAAAQTISGQHVDIAESGIRLRPWKLRWTTPRQLDAMAASAGLKLVERFQSVAEDPFTDASDRHVSVYRPA